MNKKRAQKKIGEQGHWEKDGIGEKKTFWKRMVLTQGIGKKKEEYLKKKVLEENRRVLEKQGSGEKRCIGKDQDIGKKWDRTNKRVLEKNGIEKKLVIGRKEEGYWNQTLGCWKKQRRALEKKRELETKERKIEKKLVI